MKIRNFCMAVAVLLASLTACNKSEDGVDTDQIGERDLYIKIEQPTSKADTDPVTGGTVNFSEGALYFTDDAGNILLYKRITSTPVAGTLTVQELEKGATIEKVSKKATQVHVYGNFEPAKSYTTLTEIDKIDYSTQTDDSFGVSNAGLYGSDIIVPIDETTAEAKVDVTAILSRLEVDKLIANEDEIVSYTLAGIYINNYYMEVLPNGALLSTDRAINHLQDFEKYYREALGGEYPDDMAGYLFDDGDASLEIAESVDGVVAAQKTWAYNVFAVGTTNPHIVFHFTDMVMKETGDLIVNNTTNTPGEAFLTVTGYTAKTNGNGFVNIEGGNVYKMEEVKFNEDDLGEVPEKNEKKDVEVTIKLMEWKVVPVNPNFD